MDVLAWVGVGLIALLLGDVFLTVLHPQAHGGPVNRTVMRALWGTFRAGARLLSGPARDRWLSMGAPVMASTGLIGWALLLITGFALIYAAHPDAFMHTEWVSPIGWSEAFYFSGIAATTLGMGDVLVEPGWLRGLVVAEGFLGFMLISLSAAYILSIYSAQNEASAFALEIWGAVGDDPDAGIERLMTDLDATDEWADGTARRLAGLVSEHAQYPLLHYFRPPDHRQGVVPQVGSIVRLFRRLDRDRPGWETGHPSLVMLRAITGRYLEEVSDRFVRDTGIDAEDGEDPEVFRRRHLQALRHLGYGVGAEK